VVNIPCLTSGILYVFLVQCFRQTDCKHYKTPFYIVDMFSVCCWCVLCLFGWDIFVKQFSMVPYLIWPTQHNFIAFNIEGNDYIWWKMIIKLFDLLWKKLKQQWQMWYIYIYVSMYIIFLTCRCLLGKQYVCNNNILLNTTSHQICDSVWWGY